MYAKLVVTNNYVELSKDIHEPYPTYMSQSYVISNLVTLIYPTAPTVPTYM